MNNLISEVYSNALFELSQETQKTEIHKKELSEISQIIEENQKLKEILNNPDIEKNDKKEIVSTVFEGIDNHLLNLLKILIDKGRFTYLYEIKRNFEKKYNTLKNIAQGVVHTAKPLSEKDIQEIEKTLGEKFNKTVELKNVVDTSLIGGLSISIEGKRIDNSIKSRLENLKSSLKERR